MAASKKSRKVGRIGIRKDPDYQHTTGPIKKKARKGHKPGSRHNVESDAGKKGSQGQGGNKDPRHGSKKPVPLGPVAKGVHAAERRKFATPAEELAFIEADARLALLLDKVDGQQPLSAEEQAYLDSKMTRHRLLCELMGIKPAEQTESVDDADDLFSKLKPVDHRDFL
jgi:ribosome assembly protein YihI (activator of Der GTPase)